MAELFGLFFCRLFGLRLGLLLIIALEFTLYLWIIIKDGVSVKTFLCFSFVSLSRFSASLLGYANRVISLFV